MQAYLLVTGSIFALIGVAHLVRLVVESGHGFSSDPWFFVHNFALFIVGAGIAVWAVRLFSALRSRSP